MRCFSTRAMKSAGVYRASADLAKCGFAEIKFSGWQFRLVKLQRPPPEISIFLPTRSARSSTATRRPRLPASIAHISPAAPAPRMIPSKRDCVMVLAMMVEDRNRHQAKGHRDVPDQQRQQPFAQFFF